MPYELYQDDNNILRAAFIGDVDGPTVQAYLEDAEQYLAQATPERPVYAIIDAARDGKYSAEARRRFADMSTDHRIGRIAVINASRMTRVMGVFFIKVSRRDGVLRFFESEEAAVAWLKTEREKAGMK